MNTCGGTINPLAMTEAIKLISLDYPHLDIKKLGYGYDKDVREQSGWRMAEEMLAVSGFPLLDSQGQGPHPIDRGGP